MLPVGTLTLLAVVFALAFFGPAHHGLDGPPPDTTPARPNVPGQGESTPVAPAEFAAGACRAFAPLSGDRHRTIFVDAGHGGADPGAGGTTASGEPVAEKQLTLAVALATAQRLREHGYRVVLSRTQDTTVAPIRPAGSQQAVLSGDESHTDTLARAHCANLAGAAEFVSVHFDAFDDPGTTGTTTVYDTTRPFSPRNQQLAQVMQRDLLASLAAHGQQVDDRGVTTDDTAGGPAVTDLGDSYGHLAILGPAAPNYVSEPSRMPGVLVEPLFITNAAEASIAASEDGQSALAQGISDALEQADRGP